MRKYYFLGSTGIFNLLKIETNTTFQKESKTEDPFPGGSIIVRLAPRSGRRQTDGVSIIKKDVIVDKFGFLLM